MSALKHSGFLSLACCVLFVFAGGSVLDAQEEVERPLAKMGSVGFVTDDLDGTIHFYETVLGFSVVGATDVTAPKTRQVIGVPSGEAVRYAALAPDAWVKGDKSLAILSFFEVPSASSRPNRGNASHPSFVGDAILGLSVNNLDQVVARAQAAGAPLVADLGDSGTTRTSQSISILDPNGLRLEIYEY